MTARPVSARQVPPPILDGAGELLASYDVIYCDVWGVVHDGMRAYQAADAALRWFRGNGGTVVLVSNAPVPKGRVADMLDQRGLSRQCWDDIVSSGDIAVRHIQEKGYRELHGIGPKDRDRALFQLVRGGLASLEDAEAIVCTGLNDDIVETAEDYRPLLREALARDLPFVCANPDKVVDVAGRLYLCAGAIADIYEDMGGDVFWAGKPHASAYETAGSIAEELRGRATPQARVLAIGDALRTDMKAAQTAGVDALFIAGGIHRDEVMAGGRIEPGKLAALFDETAPPAIAAMSHLKL